MLRRGSSSRAILPPPPLPPSGPVRTSTGGTVVTIPPAPNAAPGAPTACALSRLHATSLPRPTPAGALASVNSSPSPSSPHFTPILPWSTQMSRSAQTPPPPSGSSLPGPSFSHHPLPTSDTHCCKTCVSAARILFCFAGPGPPSSRESTCSGLGPC